jgi:hypothetical protein
MQISRQGRLIKKDHLIRSKLNYRRSRFGGNLQHGFAFTGTARIYSPSIVFSLMERIIIAFYSHYIYRNIASWLSIKHNPWIGWSPIVCIDELSTYQRFIYKV